MLDEPVVSYVANTSCNPVRQRDETISNDDEPRLLALLDAFERAQEFAEQLRANDVEAIESKR